MSLMSKTSSKPRALLVTRAKTDAQRNQQLKACREYCAAAGLEPRTSMAIDSGAAAGRRGSIPSALLDAARAEQVVAIVVYDLNRLGRALDIVERTVDQLRRHALELHVVSHGRKIDWLRDGPMLSVWLCPAKSERETIRARTIGGRVAAKTPAANGWRRARG